MPQSGVTTYSWRNADPEGFIEAIEAKILGDRSFARSFMAQKLRLPPAAGTPRRVTIIALDTNQMFRSYPQSYSRFAFRRYRRQESHC